MNDALERLLQRAGSAASMPVIIAGVAATTLCGTSGALGWSSYQASTDDMVPRHGPLGGESKRVLR